MENLLNSFSNTRKSDLSLWIGLVDYLRPNRFTEIDKATDNLRVLTYSLARQPDMRAAVQASFIRLFQEHKQTSLYVASGLLPSTGFFSETVRRITERLLPDVIDIRHMKDMLSLIFHRRDDEIWVKSIADEVWSDFLETLLAPCDSENSETSENAEQKPVDTSLPIAVEEIIEALRMLSFHVSAIGLDPEIVRVDPALDEYESPFLAQNAELLNYVKHYQAWWQNPQIELEDEKHLDVMLDQCNEVLLRVRRRATKLGTSIALTFKLERLHQHIVRINDLLALLNALRETRDPRSVIPRAIPLFKTLVYAECRKNNLSDYIGQNVELLSLRMTESASKTGEHYITSNQREYFGMLGSAALGGAIIACMAALKIIFSHLNMAPLNEGLAYCLNYGLGFVLIHILGGTVATKQPAMTANAIAASIGESSGKSRDLENLADIIIRMIRSQFAAIAGNVGVAIPLAIVIGLIIHSTTGTHFVSPEKAQHLLSDVNPIGGTILYAAIAGICLFLSGLISGYYDNLAAYNRIPQRLLQLQWPRRLFGDKRARKITEYIENNLGALAGNFFFGFLLGGVTTLGVLFGLPLDIRHIAFSSAYVGYALTGLDFQIAWGALGLALTGVLLIGLTNLIVSFYLTLSVAMRARNISFAQRRELAVLLLRRLIKQPHDFFFPPIEKTRQEEDTEAAPSDEASSSPSSEEPSK